MQFNSVEDAVTHLECQDYILTKTCDKQAKKIENLEDALYQLLTLLNKSDKSDNSDKSEKSQELYDLLQTHVHKCNLLTKKV